MTMANNLRRTLAVRHKNICAWGGVKPNCHGTWQAFRPVFWLVALALLGVLAAACSEDAAVTASPAATPDGVEATTAPAIPTAPPATAPDGVEATTAPAVPTAPPATATAPRGAALTTHLYALESESVRLERFTRRGGAIETIGDDLLLVTPGGRFALVFQDGALEYLDGGVPMNEKSLEEHEGYDDPRFEPRAFRVADILLKEREEGRYELFATHHYFTGTCIRFRLSSTTILRDEEGVTVLPDWKTIFDVEPCLPLPGFGGREGGGKMLTDGADHLLTIIGDHGIDGWRARPTFDPDVHLGKLLRVDIETGEAEVLAVGFRNSQGMVRDADGNIWATDHGPQGGDELNLLEWGSNYGWPQVSYGIKYGGEVPPTIEGEEVGKHDGFLQPAYAWIPSPAISAIAVNDEEHFPLWEDDLLVASLKDQSLFRVRRHGTDVKYFERIEVGYRVRDITSMPDGRIALLDDGSQVHFLSRSPRYCDEESLNRRDVYSVNCESAPALPWLDLPGAGDSDIDTTAGAQLFRNQCSACHALNAERHGLGPHLVGVIGRPAGEVEGFNFSGALRSLDVVWTRDSLAQFLTDPDKFAPGTSMSSPGLDEAEARAIVEYLDSLNHLSRLLRDNQPALRSDFDVYLVENTLVYVKEPCTSADTEATFFLAIYPVDVNDLPEHRQQHGFENLDFDFHLFGGVFDGRCAATVALPQYAIATIGTGQFVYEEDSFHHLWEGEFSVGE